MFWYDGQIHQVMVGKVFHIVRMIHRAIMHLSCTNLFYLIIIMESSRTTHYEYHLTIALMGMKSGGGTWTKCGIHDFYLVVHEITGVQFSLSALEAFQMSFRDFFKIYYHISIFLVN